MSRFLSIAGIVCTVVFLLTFSGCSQPTAAETSRSTKSSSAGSVKVTAAHPQRKTITLHTTQPGRIEAFEETPLFPKVTGYVDKVLVDIGDVVKQNQLLVKLSIPEMQDDLEQREALVVQADAQTQQAEAVIRAAKAAVDTAAAHVEQAKAGIVRVDAEHARWKAEHARITQLAADGSVTQKLVEETLNRFRASEAALQEADAAVRSAKAGLNEAQANVQKTQADHAAAAARQRVAQANLARTKTLLGYAKITAPFDGVVTRRSVDTGHYVHPADGGTTNPLIVVSRTDSVRIFVDIPEMEAPLVDGGDSPDSAVVRIQSLGGREFDANVTRTSWSLDGTNRSLRAEIDLKNADGLFRPGMYATVIIHLDERENVLALPITAIIRDGRYAFCCCVVSEKIERKRIELGLRSGDEVEVTAGLEPDDTVVLVGADSLSQGQAVEIVTSE